MHVAMPRLMTRGEFLRCGNDRTATDGNARFFTALEKLQWIQCPMPSQDQPLCFSSLAQLIVWCSRQLEPMGGVSKPISNDRNQAYSNGAFQTVMLIKELVLASLRLNYHLDWITPTAATPDV